MFCWLWPDQPVQNLPAKLFLGQVQTSDNFVSQKLLYYEYNQTNLHAACYVKPKPYKLRHWVVSKQTNKQTIWQNKTAS